MKKSYKNSYKVSNKELTSLSVYNVGHQKCLSNYQWGPGIRDHYLIHHVVSGCGTYTKDGQSYSLSEGDTFLIYPFEEISYCADAAFPWEYCWVGFSGSEARSILGATDFSQEFPILRKDKNHNQIHRYLMEIYRARGAEFENAVRMTGALYNTLALFIKSSANKKEFNTYEKYAKMGMEYIHTHYLYPIQVEDIAKYVGISRSHLFRSFREYTGKSTKEYLTDFRIRQACILLCHSELSVTAIARSVGFEDSLNFSKTFHRIKGMSPSSYICVHGKS